ncbi:MAG: hypothetical protein PVG65_03275 [Candidatus Thorarchaeota archaeon]|jgi:hypothetical protein
MEDIEIKNPIFKVPIFKFSFLECLGGETIQGERRSSCLIEAVGEIDAIVQLREYLGYWKNYNQLSKEERKKVIPFKLDMKGKIERILDCERRYKNQRGDYTCGRPVYSIEDHPDKDDECSNMNGEFGMCCIEGYDIPEYCPYNKERYAVA